MTWQHRYQPPEAALWQGRQDIPRQSCFFQIITLCHLQEEMPPKVVGGTAFALIGFCCDEGVRRNAGRVGANEGPGAIRRSFAKLSIQKPVICYDVGNITCVDGDLEGAQQALADVIALLLARKITPIVLGGGHEVAFGHHQGIVRHFPDSALNVINFDAHFDMRPLLPMQAGSSGTPFLQMAKACEALHQAFNYHCIGIQAAGNVPLLFETAKQYHVNYLLAEDIYFNQPKCTDFIDHIIAQQAMVYMSLCLDVFAAPYAPGVSAPQALGVTPWQILPLVRKLAGSGQVVSYDIAELAPAYDIDQRTAKLAAHFIQEIIHHHV